MSDQRSPRGNNGGRGRRRRGSGGNRGNNNRRPKRYGGAPIADARVRAADAVADANAKAEGRFERDEPVMGFPEGMDEPGRFSFEWPLTPVPLATEEETAGLVVRKGEFGWLPDERVEEIAAKLEGKAMSLEQALSLRSALLQQKTVYSHYRMQSRGKALRAAYDDGVSIVELSKRFDFPPMNIFRTVLAEKGWGKTKIKESFKDPKRLKQREREEFEAAEAADRVSNVDQSESAEAADLFEEILADWFEDQGVRLRRQPEMVKEQSKQHGRPIRTPDLLFLDHVEINGQPVAWIDAKHFYGADVDFQRKKMAKQMNRYIEEWGAG
ncbi:MAG: C15orf41 family protein, partial [Candidatus Poseidoniaceae archaeon]|nr:C15orf41 family protein [Candidatus Poseidoniaceae archaeon]